MSLKGQEGKCGLALLSLCWFKLLQSDGDSVEVIRL